MAELTSTTIVRGSEPELQIGSDEHKRLFCRMLLDTHDPYRPAVIPWPKLEEAAFKRLTGLPIWNIAVQIEGRASISVRTYGESLTDPLLREAVLMDGGEEQRHKDVLSKMVAFYGITLDPEPPYPAPRDAEYAFMTTGYAECIDSFFAFGLFDVARRSGFFPEALVETFEPVIQEEARHILFFVNWLAWHRRQLAWPARLWFNLRCITCFLGRIKGRLDTARAVKGSQGDKKKDKNFTATTSKALANNLKVTDLLKLCLTENDRRMAKYDARLLRPVLVPSLVQLALKFL
ncbi:MAG TPA: ferritin-like domain-containing protein [Candidatus Cybelea sp.]|nr:ferritin-like domain-containing protein [Candidatus Cybelea sp.]